MDWNQGVTLCCVSEIKYKLETARIVYKYNLLSPASKQLLPQGSLRALVITVHKNDSVAIYP